MCIVDSCFKPLREDAPRDAKISHHTHKALCAFVLTIIVGACFISTAMTVFAPLMLSEYLSLAFFATLTVGGLAKTAMEVGRAMNAYNIPRPRDRHQRIQGG